MRAKMLTAHHLEHAALMHEQGDELVYFGGYGGTTIAVVSAGFESGAIPEFVRAIEGSGVREILYIGACTGTTVRHTLGTVILAHGGSKILLSRARSAAARYGIKTVVEAVQPGGSGQDVRSSVADDVTAGLYKQALIGDIDALSVLTVSENVITGEKLEQHVVSSRFYAAARLVFETFAVVPM